MSQNTPAVLRGRCIRLQRGAGILRNQAGDHPFQYADEDGIQVGDVIEADAGGRARVLTPNRTTGRSNLWMERVLDARRRRALEIRARVEAGIRAFFAAQDFVETRTPLLVPCPGMEPHIRPYGVDNGAFLPTSPEFAMKRLLVGGLERIFQICPAFRREPFSATHHPEFTMLEWYRAYAGYEDIMRDAERLFQSLALQLFGKPVIRYQGREISVEAPWPRLRVRDLFLDKAGVDLVAAGTQESLRKECGRLGLVTSPEDTWDDLYFRIWLNLVEPRLPADRAVFVTRYPASQAALAVVDHDADGSRWARRFEVYAGGLELGNAFEELTDPVEQRRRFVEDMELRARAYGPTFPKSPLDEGFLGALEEGLPPSGGIAMGVDRIAMLFADETDLSRLRWLDSYSPTEAGGG
jgi:lysyl-tRNA synthetase class 2